MSYSGNGEVDACVGEASGDGVEEVCVGEATVVAYGNDEEDASKGEASIVVSGKSNYAIKRTCSTAEYPCVKRLRERRLLSFLWNRRLYGAFDALNDETPVLFSVRRIQGLVKQGRWAEAVVYLNTYLPPITENHKRSRRAQIFHNFLLMNYRFAKAVAGKMDKSLDKQYGDDRCCYSHAELRFRHLTYSILDSEPNQLMATYDWDKVRGHASFLVYILANTTPELRRSMPLPPGRYMMPQHLLPIGSSLHRRGHGVVKKKRPHKRDTAEAIFMALKSQHHSSLHRNSRESADEAMEMLVDFLDQTLQAGLRSGCTLSYASQPCEKEDVPDAPCVQTTLGSSTDNTKGHATSAVKFSVAPYFQTISRTSKVHSQDPGISSLTNVSAFGGRASADTLVTFMPKLSHACSF